MANKVVITDYPKNPKQIMIADSEMISLGAIIGDTGVTPDDNGRKVVKAGTPVTGNLRKRNTAFTVTSSNNAIGIVLHDVDVTAGNENGAVVIFGVVDLEKLEKDVQSKITSTIEDALDGKIFFTTGSGSDIQSDVSL